ncbi:MAG: paraquat-inducible protein A [Gammaproteobacteria bacterium]|nr:paraquat-inducible protein A [Gammaproteobacteria bacterium]MBU1645300.1 paraquat-inducible protein A [Gammaproteobacteria bacterium]MBU1972293.1 paraquat-inducible protein A [Gammaproteobacteria bacterium]
MNAVPTAAGMGLLSCEVCRLVSRAPAPGGDAHCPRCGATLHARKPASLARTWSFLIAAMLLYVPANTLPIMDTSSLFGTQRDTIVSGVAFLWTSGSFVLAALVFFASVMVPLAKMIALAVLAGSVQVRSVRNRRTRTRLFRLVEFIGRWSMLDIYVVTILVALVQVNTLATIHAGPGAAAFGAVVVLTMFAAASFDPRLIWDMQEEGERP